jgi:hypothetical protein
VIAMYKALASAMLAAMLGAMSAAVAYAMTFAVPRAVLPGALKDPSDVNQNSRRESSERLRHLGSRDFGAVHGRDR